MNSGKRRVKVARSGRKRTSVLRRRRSITLSLRTPREFRVATLSWINPANQDPLRDVETFIDDLAQVRHSLRERVPDLLLCAGFSVDGLPDLNRIDTAMQGTPVLFEDGNGRWLIVHRRGGVSRMDVVRTEQLIQSSDQVPSQAESLYDVLASGEGSITLGHDTYLLLLICGENNVLAYGGTVFKKSRSVPFELRSALRGSWIVLNPAHKPYKSKTREAGFEKIGQSSVMPKSLPPTMQRVVHQAVRSPNGPMPPLALIHVNNMHPNKPWTENFASVVFTRNLRDRLRPLSKSMDGGRWRVSNYRISLLKRLP